MEQGSGSPVPPMPQPEVGFPQPQDAPKGKSKAIKWIVALIGIVIIVAGGAFFILQDVNNSDGSEVAGTSTGDGLTTFPTPEPSSSPTPEPTATPEPVNKEDLKIEVLNGTGTPGDAGYLQKKLEDLGYTNTEAGNADEQDQTTTTITFSRDIPTNIVDELKSSLEGFYEDVTTRTSTLSDGVDIRITTGTRKSVDSESK